MDKAADVRRASSSPKVLLEQRGVLPATEPL
jgi:hypothetical protein